ncbi:MULTISPECIES: glycosyltransferase family A protein [unclassified Agromyces]|uniref:glycosyltransferase family A protein n=1 Tax=unclassified Agromyces TaxID=2639701 RepID=UPI003014B8FE
MPAPAPTVSVVIPVKDDADVLRRCLAALAAQEVRPDEIVVVDNGSTDESAEVARAAGARVVSESEPGIPAASARGFDEARCEIVARLDADSVPPPDWIARIATTFAADPGLAAVTGPATFIDGPERWRRPLAFAYLGSYFATVTPALGHVPLFGSNFAARRSDWLEVRDRVHRHDPLMHDDMDLSVHLGPRRRIRYDRALTMGVSIRALRGDRMLRLRRGMHSIVSHWPAEFPWYRWYRRAVRSRPRSERGVVRAGR